MTSRSSDDLIEIIEDDARDADDRAARAALRRLARMFDPSFEPEPEEE